MLWPLAVAQMTSWGTLYYSFSLFAGPMQAELGWSNTALNGALTCGLLVTGVMSYPVGALLDRYGGRWLMTFGSFGAGVFLLAWSQIESLAHFYLIWLAVGVCLACCLIEPMLAVVNQNFGSDARRGITALTMVTSLAGTIYVPLIGYLIPHLDWRTTLCVLALLNLCYSAPVHWWFVPPRQRRTHAPSAIERAQGRAVMRQRFRNPVFWGLTLWYTSYSLTASSLIFQFVPLLRHEGVANSVILMAFALIGPVQALARLIVVGIAPGASIAKLGAGTSTIVPIAILILIFAPHQMLWLSLFALCFGAGHGITTILRGTAPIEWLGREYFARTMGAIALPMMFAMALAPSITAQVWARTGSSRAMLATILAGSLMGSVGYWVAVLSRRGARIQRPNSV